MTCPVDVLRISEECVDEDLYKLRRAVKRAGGSGCSRDVPSPGVASWVIVTSACAVPTGAQRHRARLLPKSRPVDSYVSIDLYLPGCPPTSGVHGRVAGGPEFRRADCVPGCGRAARYARNTWWVFNRARAPDICLINQGYLCVGSSTRMSSAHAGRAPTSWLPGPSDVFIEQESEVWLKSIKRVFSSMTGC